MSHRSSSSPPQNNDEPDFVTNDEGLMVASRSLLLKRGFCCGLGCTNCPYPIDNYPNGQPKPLCRQTRADLPETQV